MQSARDFLKAEAERKLNEASGIQETAQKAARSLEKDERESVSTLLDEVRHLKARVQDIDDNEKILESIEQMKGPLNQTAEPAGAGKSIGDAFVKSGPFQALRSGLKSGQMTGNWTSGPVEIDGFGSKATLTTTGYPAGLFDHLGTNVPSAAANTLRRLTIADLIAQGTTDSGMIRYLQETTTTNAAAAVLEGDLKPESALGFTAVDEPVRKVATFLPVTDEMLEDEAQIRTYVDNRLRLFVEHAEEAQILNGAGTGANLRGILNRTGIQTGTRAALGTSAGNGAGASVIGDAIFQAITNVRVNASVEPDGIVMHPSNFATLRLVKDSAGQYLGGGPLIGAYGNSLTAGETVWGIPVVTTTAIAVNTALVGAFGTMAQVFYRNGLTVEASNSHADFFQRNLTAIRAEQRLALAVYRPQGFHAITALNVA